MDVTAIVLAAGKGTRMKSKKAKVLHELFFAPMIHHVLDAVTSLAVTETIVVTGHQGEDVERSIMKYGVQFVKQEHQLGTGHAVLVTEKFVNQSHDIVLILCGDTPLIRPETLSSFLEFHHKSRDKITVMTTKMDDPTNYGRIISYDNNHVVKIIEEKDATKQEKQVQEINAGIYCVDKKFLFEALKKVGTDNQQGEIYFTDIVKIASEAGIKVNKFVCDDTTEIIGVNSRIELESAAKVLQKRKNRELMVEGVSIMDSDTIFIEKKVVVQSDAIIHPHVYISGNTNIGKGVEIHPFCKIHDTTIADNSIIESFSNLSGKSTY